jgi:hypothetical protein
MEMETCSCGSAPDVGMGGFSGLVPGANGNGSCRHSASTPSVVRDVRIGSCASASEGARTVYGGGRVVALKEYSRWQTDPRWPSGI